MKKNFSNVFKDLRKQREMTQEQIAEVLGVSCQAISKWETNSSYPDISLLPIIADYFGVSVDCLLGHDTGKQIEEINEACAKAEKMIAEERYMEAIPPLREMLIKHPGNEKLMYQLAWNLSWTIKDSMDNYNEAILIYEKILTISSDTEMILKSHLSRVKCVCLQIFHKKSKRLKFFILESLFDIKAASISAHRLWIESVSKHSPRI